VNKPLAPLVLLYVMVVESGANTVSLATLPAVVVMMVLSVDIVRGPAAGEETVNGSDLVMPSAVTLILVPVVTASAETVAFKVPLMSVVVCDVATPKVLFSDAITTATFGTATPLASWILTVIGTLSPVVNAVPLALARVTEAPLIATFSVTALAEQVAQLAVTVAIREVWSVESAISDVVPKPVTASVVTEEEVKTAPPVTDKDNTLPFTIPPDASKARTVNANDVVASALIDKGLGAVKSKLATVAVVVGVVTGAVADALPSPPPPPHADKATAISTPIVVLSIDIVNALFMPRKI
jgi:hypothetical protein